MKNDDFIDNVTPPPGLSSGDGTGEYAAIFWATRVHSSIRISIRISIRMSIRNRICAPAEEDARENTRDNRAANWMTGVS